MMPRRGAPCGCSGGRQACRRSDPAPREARHGDLWRWLLAPAARACQPRPACGVCGPSDTLSGRTPHVRPGRCAGQGARFTGRRAGCNRRSGGASPVAGGESVIVSRSHASTRSRCSRMRSSPGGRASRLRTVGLGLFPQQPCTRYGATLSVLPVHACAEVGQVGRRGVPAATGCQETGQCVSMVCPRGAGSSVAVRSDPPWRARLRACAGLLSLPVAWFLPQSGRRCLYDPRCRRRACPQRA
jgi:hypothetical protein